MKTALQICAAVAVKVGDAWRIKRADGELVGWFTTKALAERTIVKSPWLKA
jgi:SH3-like domain-containing protein